MGILSQAGAAKTDHRREERSRTLMSGRVIYNNGRSVLDCQIRNLSVGGAKLNLSAAVTLPVYVQLEIPSRNAIFKAMLRWRAGDNAGLEFMDGAGAQGSEGQSSASGRLGELERENAILRKRVTEMANRLAELGFSSDMA